MVIHAGLAKGSSDILAFVILLNPAVLKLYTGTLCGYMATDLTGSTRDKSCANNFRANKKIITIMGDASVFSSDLS